MSIIVQNLTGTTELTCGCKSWLAHWERVMSVTVRECLVTSSGHSGQLVGAHVQKEASIDRNHYIIPMCTAHNNKKGSSLPVTSETDLAPANKRDTCGA